MVNRSRFLRASGQAAVVNLRKLPERGYGDWLNVEHPASRSFVTWLLCFRRKVVQEDVRANTRRLVAQFLALHLVPLEQFGRHWHDRGLYSYLHPGLQRMLVNVNNAIEGRRAGNDNYLNKIHLLPTSLRKRRAQSDATHYHTPIVRALRMIKFPRQRDRDGLCLQRDADQFVEAVQRVVGTFLPTLVCDRGLNPCLEFRYETCALFRIEFGLNVHVYILNVAPSFETANVILWPALFSLGEMDEAADVVRAIASVPQEFLQPDTWNLIQA